MLEKLFYIFLFIVLLVYIILILMKKKVLINNDKITKVITLIFSSLLLANIFNIILSLFLKADILVLLSNKMMFELIIFSFAIVYIISRLMNHFTIKENFLTKSNIIILCYIAIATLILIFSLTSTKVTMNDNKIIIKDFCYYKEFNFNEVDLIGEFDTMPIIEKNYIHLNNRFCYKGYYKTIDGINAVILNNLSSDKILYIKTNNKYYYYGVKNRDGIENIIIGVNNFNMMKQNNGGNYGN